MTTYKAEKCFVLTQYIFYEKATNFRERLAGKIDVLLFNPPYVVTPSEEVVYIMKYFYCVFGVGWRDGCRSIVGWWERWERGIYSIYIIH